MIAPLSESTRAARLQLIELGAENPVPLLGFDMQAAVVDFVAFDLAEEDLLILAAAVGCGGCRLEVDAIGLDIERPFARPAAAEEPRM